MSSPKMHFFDFFRVFLKEQKRGAGVRGRDSFAFLAGWWCLWRKEKNETNAFHSKEAVILYKKPIKNFIFLFTFNKKYAII